MSSTLEVHEAIRNKILDAGYHQAHDLFSFDRAAETTLNELFILLPSPADQISKSGSCVSYKRNWILSIAFVVIGRSEKGVFELTILNVEDELVDSIHTLEFVSPDGVRVAYREIAEGRYIIMDITIITQYERVSV